MDGNDKGKNREARRKKELNFFLWTMQNQERVFFLKDKIKTKLKKKREKWNPKSRFLGAKEANYGGFKGFFLLFKAKKISKYLTFVERNKTKQKTRNKIRCSRRKPKEPIERSPKPKNNWKMGTLNCERKCGFCFWFVLVASRFQLSREKEGGNGMVCMCLLCMGDFVFVLTPDYKTINKEKESRWKGKVIVVRRKLIFREK